MKRYSSAGILPYSVVDDRVYLLLGCESCDGSWSDFGGKMEIEDGEDSVQTACREFTEETLGVIMSLNDIKNKIKQSVCLNSVTYSGQVYLMYMVQIPWCAQHSVYFSKTYQFMGRLNHNPIYRKYLEKKNIRWFPATDILTNRTHVRLRSVFYDTLRLNSAKIVQALYPNSSP